MPEPGGGPVPTPPGGHALRVERVRPTRPRHLPVVEETSAGGLVVVREAGAPRKKLCGSGEGCTSPAAPAPVD